MRIKSLVKEYFPYVALLLLAPPALIGACVVGKEACLAASYQRAVYNGGQKLEARLFNAGVGEEVPFDDGGHHYSFRPTERRGGHGLSMTQGSSRVGDLYLDGHKLRILHAVYGS